eukprot:COSAG01_NODE_46121_length_403_cov_0.509868_1_plen_68_part_01
MPPPPKRARCDASEQAARRAPALSALHVAGWVGAMNCLGEGARGGMPRLLTPQAASAASQSQDPTPAA